MGRITVAIAAEDGSDTTEYQRVLRQDAAVTILLHAPGDEDLVARMLRLKPRILLLSVDLCTDTECSVLVALRRQCPATLVVLLTHHSIQEDQLANALAVGARGYLEEADLERLLTIAVHGVDRGEAWVPRKMLGKIMAMAFP